MPDSDYIKYKLSKLKDCDCEECDALYCSDQSTCSASFSVEEIRYYLEGLLVTPDGKINVMLCAAIDLLEDDEDGIEAALKRRKQNERGEPHGE